MAQIESWKLEEIRDGLRIARNSLLELTALDSLEEMERKCKQNESAVTRKLDKCLEWLKYIEEDKKVIAEHTCKTCKFWNENPRCKTGVPCNEWKLSNLLKNKK